MTRPTVYQTNLAGIGVRVSLRAIGGYGGFPDRPTPSPFSQRVDNPAALPDAVWKLGYFRLTIELIKTGPAATPGELEYHSERFNGGAYPAGRVRLNRQDQHRGMFSE